MKNEHILQSSPTCRLATKETTAGNTPERPNELANLHDFPARKNCLFAMSRTLIAGTSRALTILCALSFSAIAACGRTAIYDNSTPVTGDWIAFGSGNAFVDGDETTATYGETFTAPLLSPSDRLTYLDEWTFYLKQIPLNLGGLGTKQSFEFFIMSWDGTGATGPILYHSQRMTVGAETTAYKAFTIHPIDLALKPGKQYVIFINLSLEGNNNSPLGSSLEMAGNGNGGLFYPATGPSPLGGQFVYQYTFGEFFTVEELGAAVAAQDWATWAVEEYAAYDAVFTGRR